MCAMEDMVYECRYKKFKKGSKHVYSPKKFVDNLNSFCSDMVKGQQQDAHEFYRLLINAMQDSAIAKFSAFEKKYQDKSQINRIFETSVIHRIFGGYFQSKITCQTCKNAFRTFDTMLDLSMDMYECKSVDEVLQRSNNPIILKGQDDMYKCEYCKKKTEAEKTFTIYKFPLILTLQLKRFSVRTKRIAQKQLRIPKNLNLMKYLGFRKMKI